MNNYELKLYKQFLTDAGLPAYRQEPTPLKAPVADLEAYKKLKAIKDNIIDFVKQHKNLLICSSTTGNGKTAWATNMLIEYTKQAIEKIGAGDYIFGAPPAMFVHTPTFLLQAKDFDNGTLSAVYKDMLLNADLVIWDDVAAGKNSNYDMQQLLLYIDSRIFNGKSNIFTSNVTTVKGMEQCFGERLASRIYNTSTVITFVAKDARSEYKN